MDMSAVWWISWVLCCRWIECSDQVNSQKQEWKVALSTVRLMPWQLHPAPFLIWHVKNRVKSLGRPCQGPTHVNWSQCECQWQLKHKNFSTLKDLFKLNTYFSSKFCISRKGGSIFYFNLLFTTSNKDILMRSNCNFSLSPSIDACVRLSTKGNIFGSFLRWKLPLFTQQFIIS